MRTYDIDKIVDAMSQYRETYVGFKAKEWITNGKNIALTNSNGDILLFEDQVNLPDTVCAHYFLYSRGKEAIKACQEFLEELFTTTQTKIIIGLTPTDHKAALWMNRRLGLKELDTVDTVEGPHKLVTLTKKEWEESVNE